MNLPGAIGRATIWSGTALMCAGLLVGCSDSGSGSAAQTPAVSEPTTSVPSTSDAAPASTSAPAIPAPVAPPLPEVAPGAVAVTDVIDGDTIDTTVGRIRVIGIDTPERGECNFGPATSLLKRLIAESGNQVVLIGASDKDDTDRYGRLLRYIDSPSGLDFGRELIAAGYAIARYDSRDGYGAHPREADYVALDAAVAQIPCPGAPSSMSSTDIEGVEML